MRSAKSACVTFSISFKSNWLSRSSSAAMAAVSRLGKQPSSSNRLSKRLSSLIAASSVRAETWASSGDSAEIPATVWNYSTREIELGGDIVNYTSTNVS
ncbi:hypothetical protein PGTUg99_032352 [Puccinia graminis f. sp. tritici]|uniref:Uncharacterized protein n=1 Tax=Puccinia graminis f. sp. tritici TaxID=56615 RepID=A0A5B0S132_PUCGR|nr:hypothetical protein PGTUg99_032352 [Puccinia graminis f. sp. tritici]